MAKPNKAQMIRAERRETPAMEKRESKPYQKLEVKLGVERHGKKR